MKTYFIISNEKRNEIYSSFDSALNGVNLSEVSKDDLNETLYNIATDMLVDEFHEMEDSAANNGIRDFNVLNEIRCSKIAELISNYLNNKDMKPFEKQNFVNRVFVSELNINKNHYSIVRTIIAQNYGCLTIRKETYKNNKFHSIVTNTKSLESFNLSVKTGYFKEVTNNK